MAERMNAVKPRIHPVPGIEGAAVVYTKVKPEPEICRGFVWLNFTTGVYKCKECDLDTMIEPRHPDYANVSRTHFVVRQGDD
jgi:hypothetical protein